MLFADAMDRFDWTHAVVGIVVSAFTGVVSVTGTAIVFYYRIQHLIEASRIANKVENRAEQSQHHLDSDRFFNQLKELAKLQESQIQSQNQRISSLENRISELEGTNRKLVDDYRQLCDKYEQLQDEHMSCPLTNCPSKNK
jgi:septal ring factor EnvC (AmiA/AmiB activator)